MLRSTAKPGLSLLLRAERSMPPADCHVPAPTDRTIAPARHQAGWVRSPVQLLPLQAAGSTLRAPVGCSPSLRTLRAPPVHTRGSSPAYRGVAPHLPAPPCVANSSRRAKPLDPGPVPPAHQEPCTLP